MRNLFTDSQKALLNLPPKNDKETEVSDTWNFSEGLLTFDGQDFLFPEGLNVEASSQWLEDSLLLVNIGIVAAVQTECARCLEPANLEISGNLGYLYCLRNAEESLSDSFDEYMTVEVDFFGRVIDIMPQIVESVFTLLPTKVLCREDCKGLCPVCGKNLNEGCCSCDSQDIDPRLEALRNFKQGDELENGNT